MCSLSYLKRFTNNKLNILFSDIDVDWLKRYEAWFKRLGYKETTMSIQFRTLRSAYNKAIEAKAVSSKNYPFKEYQVSKFNTKTVKRALNKDDILKIITTETINAPRLKQLARDTFKFAYLCAGMPFVDIANLTPDNIVKGRLIYVRQKTHGDINVTICEKIVQESVSRKTRHYISSIPEKSPESLQCTLPGIIVSSFELLHNYSVQFCNQ